MSFARYAALVGERVAWPDAVTRAAIGGLVGRTARRLSAGNTASDRDFATAMAAYPIAVHTEAANAQHYEVPAEFFALVLGPRRKYSCCLYEDGAETLADAEAMALEATARHADLGDGQRILELGCGWGSLSLWMAERFPSSTIMSVSNSHSQRRFILEEAARRGLANLEVMTADMNAFYPGQGFDRVVSVEMFEHMANWRPLLLRVRDSLAADGRLFLHVFAHRSAAYRFSETSRDDWIGQHFFTGGIMPSHALVRQFADVLAVEAEWQWSGRNYQRTADDWLDNYDRNLPAIRPILDRVYGREARVWERRWRLFFLATSGLFGYGGGREWGISHYRLRPAG